MSRDELVKQAMRDIDAGAGDYGRVAGIIERMIAAGYRKPDNEPDRTVRPPAPVIWKSHPPKAPDRG